MKSFTRLLAVLFVLWTVVSCDPVTDRWNLTYPADASPFWRLLCKTRPVFTGRADPIISPGGYSGHVHKVFGSSGFGLSTTQTSNVDFYNQLVNGKCTSCNIAKMDMSAYWHPELYYRDPATKQMTIVRGEGLTVYYLSRRGGNPNWWIPFPKGFRMIAGDQSRRSYDPKNLWHTSVSYSCYGGNGFSGAPEVGGFPGYGNKKIGCSALRLQMFFPSCWNGKDLDVPDHHSHMAYPIGSISQGDCPSTHPYRLPGIFFEAFYNTGDYPHGDGVREWPFVLAQSDETGYGMHADFVSGWNEEFLHKALHDPSCNCGNVDCCDTFKPYQQGAGLQCPIDKPVGWFEDVGMATPITKLPGCNNFTGLGSNAPNCPSPSPATTDASTGVHKAFIASANNGILTPPWIEPWADVTINRKDMDLDNVWSVVNVPGQQNVVVFQNLLSKGFLVHWTGTQVYSMQQALKDAQQNSWYWWTPVSQPNGLTAFKSVKDGSWLTYDKNLLVSSQSVGNLTSFQLWKYSDNTKWSGGSKPGPVDTLNPGNYVIKQTSTKKFLTTKDNGELILSNNSTIYKVTTVSGGFSILSAKTNKYITAGNNGNDNLVANRGDAGSPFVIKANGQSFTISAANNKFVTVQSDGRVKPTATKADSSNTWAFETA